MSSVKKRPYHEKRCNFHCGWVRLPCSLRGQCAHGGCHEQNTSLLRYCPPLTYRLYTALSMTPIIECSGAGQDPT